VKVYHKLTGEVTEVTAYLSVSHVADEDGFVTAIHEKFHVDSDREAVKRFCAYKYGLHPENVHIEGGKVNLTLIPNELADELKTHFELKDALETSKGLLK